MLTIKDALLLTTPFILFLILLYTFQQFNIKVVVPIQEKIVIQHKEEEKLCLKQNIHYEAEGEPFLGKLAVGLVTLNRKNLSNKSICQTVFEPYQFSWTTTVYNPKTVFSEDISLATYLLLESIIDIKHLNNIVYFHNKKVSPIWAKDKEKVTVIGNHVFYREYGKQQ